MSSSAARMARREAGQVHEHRVTVGGQLGAGHERLALEAG
jgi:hypothetical protein